MGPSIVPCQVAAEFLAAESSHHGSPGEFHESPRWLPRVGRRGAARRGPWKAYGAAMDETSLSLLDSLRDPGNVAAWNRLMQVYGPLIRNWLRRQQLEEQDVDDVTQEVLTVLARKIQQFERQQQVGSFRSWLRKVTVNCLRDFRRGRRSRPRGDGGTRFAEMVEQLADPASGMSRLWNQEHDRHVFQYLCRQARPKFSEQTWAAFRRVALRGEDARSVADELGMTVNAVYVARCRVLAHLRHLGRGLLD